MAKKKDEVLGALLNKRTINQLCELIGEEENSLKVSSIVMELQVERKVFGSVEKRWDPQEKRYVYVGVYRLTDEEYRNQMQILWNFFSSSLCNEIVQNFLLEELKREKMTIGKLVGKINSVGFNIDQIDQYDVMSVMAELEYEEKVAFCGFSESRWDPEAERTYYEAFYKLKEQSCP